MIDYAFHVGKTVVSDSDTWWKCLDTIILVSSVRYQKQNIPCITIRDVESQLVSVWSRYTYSDTHPFFHSQGLFFGQKRPRGPSSIMICWMACHRITYFEKIKNSPSEGPGVDVEELWRNVSHEWWAQGDSQWSASIDFVEGSLHFRRCQGEIDCQRQDSNQCLFPKIEIVPICLPQVGIPFWVHVIYVVVYIFLYIYKYIRCIHTWVHMYIYIYIQINTVRYMNIHSHV